MGNFVSSALLFPDIGAGIPYNSRKNYNLCFGTKIVTKRMETTLFSLAVGRFSVVKTAEFHMKKNAGIFSIF